MSGIPTHHPWKNFQMFDFHPLSLIRSQLKEVLQG